MGGNEKRIPGGRKVALKLWHKACLVAQTGIDAEDAKKHLGRKFQNMERHDIDEAYRMEAVLIQQASIFADLLFDEVIQEKAAIRKLKNLCTHFSEKTCEKALMDACFDDIR